jgi:hypothetical protein
MVNKIGFIPGSERFIIATNRKTLTKKRDKSSSLRKNHSKEPNSIIVERTEISINLKNCSETYFSLL